MANGGGREGGPEGTMEGMIEGQKVRGSTSCVRAGVPAGGGGALGVAAGSVGCLGA